MKEKFFTDDLENMVEDIVFKGLSDIIENEEKDFCQCNICIQDIAAITLNYFPALYKSNFFDKNNPNSEDKRKIADINSKLKDKLFEAIDLIKIHPHCSNNLSD